MGDKMNGYEIAMLVCTICWGINCIGSYWCLWQANKDRKKAKELLDKIEKATTEVDKEG